MVRLTLLFLLITLTGRAQHPALLPLPRELAWTTQPFVLTGSIRLQTNRADAQLIADSIALFARQISRATVSSATNAGQATKTIEVLLEPSGDFRDRP